MTKKYVMIDKEKFDDIKTEFDKMYGEVSNKLVSIVGLLTGYDLGIEDECSDWDSISKEDRKKYALCSARQLMEFLEAVERVNDVDCEEISENDLKDDF